MPYKYKSTGIALSGGFLRAVASIGVLEELAKNNIEFDCVSGSSSGSLVAAAYATGKLELLKSELYKIKNTRKFFVMKLEKEAVLSNKIFKDFLYKIFGEATIESLPKKLFIQASDLKEKKEVYITTGQVVEAVLASMTLPGMFAPVKKNNMILFDGGCYELVPISILKKQGCQFIVGVFNNLPPSIITRLTARFRGYSGQVNHVLSEYTKLSSNMVSYALCALDQSTAQMQHRVSDDQQTADLLLRPALGKIGRYDISKIDKIIQAGQQAAQEAVPFIQANIKG
jgi:NTE family protein